MTKFVHPVLGFIHHGGRGDAFLLVGLIAVSVLAVFLFTAVDKSK